jgi:hypothetical protein
MISAEWLFLSSSIGGVHEKNEKVIRIEKIKVFVFII